jgi:hypothetical protein
MGQYFSYLSSLANATASSYFPDKNYLIFTSASDDELKAIDLLMTTHSGSTFVLVITPNDQFDKVRSIHEYCDVVDRTLEVKYVVNENPPLCDVNGKYFIAAVDIMHITWRYIHMIVLSHSVKTMECMLYIDHTDIVSIKCYGFADENNVLCSAMSDNMVEVHKLFSSFDSIELYCDMMGIIISYLNNKFIISRTPTKFNIVLVDGQYVMDRHNIGYKCCIVKTINSETFNEMMLEYPLIH